MNRHGWSWPWSGVRAAMVRIRSISSALGPGPTSSRGLPDRRVSSSDRIELRSFSIVTALIGSCGVRNNALHNDNLAVTVARQDVRGESRMVDTPAVEEPFSPASGKSNPADKATWFGHPRQLARLFTTEMWERFGYYGMRALLTLYLTKHFIFGDHAATGLYGGYTALVYLTPLVGGFLADQYLGSKRAVKFGAIMMALGYFTLCFGGDTAKPYATIGGHRYDVQVTNYSDRPTSSKNEVRYLVDQGKRFQIRGNDDGSVSLLDPAGSGAVARTIPKGGFESGGERSPLFVLVMLIALSMIWIGNGFFKPNISTMVGALYAQGDRRRDAGFTIFYMGINLGSIGSQLLCPLLADWFGWWARFGLAAAGLLFSWSLIQYEGGRRAGYGEPPERTGGDRAILIYILALLAIPVFYFLF